MGASEHEALSEDRISALDSPTVSQSIFRSAFSARACETLRSVAPQVGFGRSGGQYRSCKLLDRRVK